MYLTLALIMTASPLQVVKSVTEDRAQKQSAESFANALETKIDFTELSRRSLADGWNKLDRRQRQVFVETLQSLLRANWLQKLVNDRGDAGVQFGNEVITGDEAKVETSVQMGDEPLPIVYRLHRDRLGNWKIFDVVTDGASLVELYQQQFRKQLASEGYDGLLRSMKAKVAQLERR